MTTAFDRYEAAHFGNDVKTLDALFWKSNDVIRYGAGENLYGQDEILAFRQSRPPKGLERPLTRTVIPTFGNDFGTANTEFLRNGVERIGRQSHSWALGFRSRLRDASSYKASAKAIFTELEAMPGYFGIASGSLAKLMNLAAQSLKVSNPADIMVVDVTAPSMAVAELS